VATTDRRIRETEALRERILDTAEDIMVREGIRQITMRRIAAAVDYAPTVLYRLFDNKAGLMEQLIARGYEGVRDRYREVDISEHDEPLAALRQLLGVYVDYALGHPNHYRMWFETGDLHRDGENMIMSHDRLKYVVFGAWLEHIARCQDDGLWTEQTPDAVFQRLWSRIHGLISLRLQHPGFPWRPADAALDDVLA